MRLPGVAKSTNREWSLQQRAIFEAFRNAPGHVLVRARAGTGKTTTILEALQYAPESKILLGAFNKQIADELQTRVSDARVQAKTLHALGMGYIRAQVDEVRVDANNRAWDLVKDVADDAPQAIKVALKNLHTKVRELNPWAETPSDIERIAIAYDLVPDESELRGKWTEAHYYETVLTILEHAADDVEVIDFADMIFLPLRRGWAWPVADLVVVDEAQDMTGPQLEIALRACRKDGRIVIVGDDRQAIYGFRGAASDGLDRLKKRLEAVELGLTMTYRCGKAIVEVARALVPDFQAAPTAPEGTVRTAPLSAWMEAQPGDFVLSRVNAPLMGVALGLIRQGKRARIRGRDIGKGLVELVSKLKVKRLEDLDDTLEQWSRREIARLNKKDQAVARTRIAQIMDNVDTLLTLAETTQSIAELQQKLTTLFSDEGVSEGVVMCSTIHRAKGLEAGRVWVLQDTLRSGNIEEENCAYVAYTRAKDELIIVTRTHAEVSETHPQNSDVLAVERVEEQ